MDLDTCWSNKKGFPELNTNLTLYVDQETFKVVVCVLAISSSRPQERSV